MGKHCEVSDMTMLQMVIFSCRSKNSELQERCRKLLRSPDELAEFRQEFKNKTTEDQAEVRKCIRKIMPNMLSYLNVLFE